MDSNNFFSPDIKTVVLGEPEKVKQSKHDAIVAIDDNGEVSVIRTLTERSDILELLWGISDLPYQGQHPAGLYYVNVSLQFCGGDSCTSWWGECDCGEYQLVNLTPIYQLSEVE